LFFIKNPRLTGIFLYPPQPLFQSVYNDLPTEQKQPALSAAALLRKKQKKTLDLKPALRISLTAIHLI